jgi:hypothetical protein
VIVNAGGATRRRRPRADARGPRGTVAERFGVVLENEVIPIGSLAALWRGGDRSAFSGLTPPPAVGRSARRSRAPRRPPPNRARKTIASPSSKTTAPRPSATLRRAQIAKRSCERGCGTRERSRRSRWVTPSARRRSRSAGTADSRARAEAARTLREVPAAAVDDRLPVDGRVVHPQVSSSQFSGPGRAARRSPSRARFLRSAIDGSETARARAEEAHVRGCWSTLQLRAARGRGERRAVADSA